MITRRDFLNGILLAAGGVVLGGCPAFPQSPDAAAIITPDQLVKGGINSDPRALVAGNKPSAFTIGHWMRDERLTFNNGSVTLKKSGIDTASGTFPILDDTGRADLIIVGSGMSGLSSAFFVKRARPGTSILFLDANDDLGGNAATDSSSELPFPVSAAAAYGSFPSDEYLKDIYRRVGVDWQAHLIPGPFYNYFFDSHTPHVSPHTRRWALDVYDTGVAKMPYPADAVRDLVAARQDLMHWFQKDGAPTDPPDNSNVRFDYLSQISFADYIKAHHWHPAVTDFYDKYLVDTLTGPCEYMNAHSAIATLSSEYFSRFALPGGNHSVALKIVAWLMQNSNHPDILDLPGRDVRIRQRTIVVRIDDVTDGGVQVTYFKDGQFYRVAGKAAIVASQGHAGRHIVGHLATDERRQAWQEETLAPAVVASVAVRRAAPFVHLGLGYDQYWWGSKYWNDFVIADWTGPHRHDPHRRTVLSFYSGNSLPPASMPNERYKVMSTPFSEYEHSMREDLARMMAGTDFDFDKDVSAIHLYRWGHGLVYPKVGSIFGAPTGPKEHPVRRPAPRHAAREPLGSICFAGQDTEGTPSIESAIGSGHRAAHEVLPLLAR